MQKNFQFTTVCNGDMAYVTQLKQQKWKGCYYLGAVDIMAMSSQRNSTFLIFAVLVVWCRPCCRYSFKL